MLVLPSESRFCLIFLKNFIKNYPNIELIIDEVTTDEVISGLNEGDIIYLDAEDSHQNVNEIEIQN